MGDKNVVKRSNKMSVNKWKKMILNDDVYLKICVKGMELEFVFQLDSEK